MLTGFLDNLFYFYKTADDIISMYKVENTRLLGVQENKKRLFEIRQRFINNEFIHWIKLKKIILILKKIVLIQ